MKLHLRPIPPQHSNANIRISEKRRAELRAQLEHEVAESRISKQLVDKHNERARNGRLQGDGLEKKSVGDSIAEHQSRQPVLPAGLFNYDVRTKQPQGV